MFDLLVLSRSQGILVIEETTAIENRAVGCHDFAKSWSMQIIVPCCADLTLQIGAFIRSQSSSNNIFTVYLYIALNNYTGQLSSSSGIKSQAPLTHDCALWRRIYRAIYIRDEVSEDNKRLNMSVYSAKLIWKKARLGSSGTRHDAVENEFDTLQSERRRDRAEGEDYPATLVALSGDTSSSKPSLTISPNEI